ncbi:MAG: winged helix-turn-helix domain-containing protein [Chloroflexi bacterium]|nr:winged helix-turn-helix domain-containing protein [Chloroflexota bacterium]
MIERAGTTHSQSLDEYLADHGIKAISVSDDRDLVMSPDQPTQVALIDNIVDDERRCSVSGWRIDLRLKEYELLRLMASNPRRVDTQEALLSAVWGYEYLGGTRAVDVHIRRLRSKIKEADLSFIEIVWQFGYRLRHYSEVR